jgi:hypothetical protein
VPQKTEKTKFQNKNFQDSRIPNFFFFISSDLVPGKISYEINIVYEWLYQVPTVPGSVAVAYMRDLEILILMKGN